MTDNSRARTAPRLLDVVGAAAIITVAFMGSVVVTPLYSVFQHRFGFSDLTLTLVYAAYVVGNTVALLVAGQVSDQIGRKRAAVVGLLLAAASGVCFLLAEGTAWLYGARVLIGLAVGILSGTGTAWLVEQAAPERRSAATVTAATANLCGIAIGPTLGGVLGQYAPSPLVLPFVVYLVLVAAASVGVLRTPDHRGPQIARIRELRVQVRLGVPRELVGRFAAPAVAAFVTFALGGLYFALIPGIVIRDLHIANLAVGGLVVTELAVVAVVCLLLGRSVPAHRAMVVGLLALLPAVVLIVTAQLARSLPLLLVATLFGGLTLSFGYRGSLDIVNDLAPADRRAEMASTYFLVCFLGNAVPVIGIGVLTGPAGATLATTVFAVVIAVLAVVAIGWHRAGATG